MPVYSAGCAKKQKLELSLAPLGTRQHLASPPRNLPLLLSFPAALTAHMFPPPDLTILTGTTAASDFRVEDSLAFELRGSEPGL